MAEKEYIDKEFVINTINELKAKPLPKTILLEHLQQIIEDISAADVAPVRHGHWVKEKPDVLIHWHCSVCENCYYLEEPKSNYCPECGAKMRKTK